MTAGTASLENVVNTIRTLAQTRRIRVTEFFQDFDRLRSGFVSDSQFFRCLWANLGVKFSPVEEKIISDNYDIKGNGRIHYKSFCEQIDKNFNPSDVYRNPESQTYEAPEFLGTERSMRPLSPEAESRIHAVLRKMYQYYQYHGINLRTCYEDFDRHHRGIVTESQFYRSFPGPPDVSESDMMLLVAKYKDPEKPGLLNYLNLHHDIVVVGEQIMREQMIPGTPSQNIDGQLLEGADPTLNQIFDKIRVAVFKNGIRTKEFFKDHDKLRSGIITENQFVCGLMLAVGKEAQLSRAEIQKVVEFYKKPDGRVEYKELCDMMENAFSIPDLEKKPTQGPIRPMRGALSRGLRQLSSDEEFRLKEIMTELSDQVRRRRLMMYPYFKDYDRGIAYTRVVTKTQFGRILHFLSLSVTTEDLKLLCRKFEDPSSGDVNYPAFVQAVDQEFVGHTMEDVNLQDPGRTNTLPPEKTVKQSEVSFEDLMARIRNLVLTSSLRVIEYFQDYDPLRSGSISKTQFRRGLGLLGFSKLGQHDITDGQFKMLCDIYQNPNKEDQVLWTKFLWDIESVFTQPNLEKIPEYKVPPSEIFRVSKPGTLDWNNAADDHVLLVEQTMKRLSQRASQRRLLAKPLFQDFDKHNSNHVTRAQFRQCLTMLELHCTEPEMDALEAKFCNDVGFNYLAFLNDLQPQEPPCLMYMQRLQELRLTNQRRSTPFNEVNVASNLEGVLFKVKMKVCKERVRVLEFMRDYDKLKSGRMLKTSFRRALDLCRFELRESEVAILEDRYQSSQDQDYVDYLKFCDEVESIFTTKDLEKAPLLDVTQLVPVEEWTTNKLSQEAEEKFNMCMHRLSEKVRKYRMQLFPLFEDYDRVHNGSVSRSQFRRVLSELELGSLVNEQEFQLLWQKFEVKVGGKDDVNYIAFCDMIYDLAHFEWRKP